MLSPRSLALSLAVLLLVSASSCAPALPKPKSSKGWKPVTEPAHLVSDKQRKENVAIRERDHAKENEKFRALAAEGSEEENDALERLCKHPWWDEEERKYEVEADPWYFERMLERIQPSDETTYYVGKTVCVLGLRDLSNELERQKGDGKAPADMTLEQFLGKRVRGPFFELTLKRNPTRETRARLEVIRALLDALDEAEASAGCHAFEAP
jgi:hypothetical protein